ncbi:transporter substrate-binding domain-containing protein [Ectopseudomonas mendocina]|uniref:histidine kinase n=1 Tax=Ectopseudomonas mendocina TaxID=300 RepID=A0ABZ2RDZ1_ECTME
MLCTLPTLTRRGLLCCALLFATLAALLTPANSQADTDAASMLPVPAPSLNRLLSMRSSLPSQTLRVARIQPSGREQERAENQVLNSISDEYLKQISRYLDLNIEFVDVASPQAGVDALIAHHVDVLTRATGFEKQNPGLMLTLPYLPTKPIVIGRSADQSQPLDLSDVQILTLDEYLPAASVQAAYPKAKVSLVSDTPMAFELLASDKADAFIADQFRANLYLHERTDLQLQNKFVAQLPPTGFSFAVRNNEPVLLALINYVLRSIPEAEKNRIQEQARDGRFPYFYTDAYILTPAEQQWLKQHQQITVLADDTPAYMYRSRAGYHWAGLSVKLLESLESIYGLKVNFMASQSAENDLIHLRNGSADLASRSLGIHDKDALFTLPYGTRNWTFLIRDGDSSPSSLEAMEGRKLALSRDHPLYQQLRQRYPNIRLIGTENFRHSMSLILNRQVDATLVSTASTDHQPEPGLQYGLSIKATPTPHRFVVAPGSRELMSIINKLLDAMSRNPQSEIQVIAETPGNALWKWLADKAWQVGLAVALVFGLSMLWNWRLQIQVRKRISAQNLLQDKLAFQFSLFNGMPTPLYVCDLKGRLNACNRAYEEFFSTTQECAEGALPSEQQSIPHDFALTLENEHQQLLLDHQPRFLDTCLSINGEEHYLYLWLVPFYNARGKLQGSLGGWLDITARKQLEIELREAKQVAQDANAAKSEFLASMSHELRTPLNALVGLLELETSDRKNTSRNLRIAQQSATAMIDLIGNILDLDKIESGQMQLAPQLTALEVLLSNSLGLFSAQAQEKQLALSLDFQADPQRCYWVDTLRLQQIIHNLLNNALRFTEHGSVQLQVRETTLAQGSSLLRFSVCDTGIGIPLELQPQIFEPYRQATAQTVHCYGGSGLGLTICKQLTALMGGRIWLQSAPGAGCSVHVEVTLDWQHGPEQLCEEPATDAATQRPLKVLVVDDVSTNGLVLSLQLAQLGHQAEHVSSGQQALLALQQGEYDVLISDCNMPDMDGYALTRAVREQEQQASLPARLIIGYTANAMSNEAEQCREAGMDDLMIKPVTLARLREALSGLSSADEEESLYSLDHLLGADHNSPQLRQRILTEVVSNLSTDWQALQALDLSRNPEAIREVSHRLSGLACMIDSHALAVACHALEQSHEQDAQAIRQAQTRLKEALHRLRAGAEEELASLA